MNSPSRFARVIGLLYLVPTVLGPFSLMYVPSKLVVPGDALATSTNLRAMESLLRLGWTGELLIVLSELLITSMLFTLLRPVGRSLAISAFSARLAMTVLQAANVIPGLAAFALATSNQPELALRAMELKGTALHLWETCFALHCLVLGVAVFRSTFFPRALGVLVGVAGLGYLLSGVGSILAPPATPVIAGVVAVTAIVGEVPFVLWLCVKGVDATAWQARAQAS